MTRENAVSGGGPWTCAGPNVSDHGCGIRSSDDLQHPPAASASAGEQAPLRLALFGGLQIRQNGCELAERLPGRKGRALVAYLVLNEDRPVARDELLHVLWPSRAPADPNAALSCVLAKVRRVVGSGLIQGRQALALQLPADAYLDVHVVGAQSERAERAVVGCDPATALETAQALLETLNLALLPDLEGDWLETWRRRFDERLLRMLEIAAGAGLALGERTLPGAERSACELVAREPFREAGYILLMQAHARQGNVAEALRTFEQIRVRLREELGTHPSSSLTALHARLLREDGGVAANSTTPVQPGARATSTVTSQMIDGAFVGREAFSQRLRMRWEKRRAAEPGLVFLVGEAGIGKTRLAAEFAEEVHATGATVLYGRADEETLLPHQPFVEALCQLVARREPVVMTVVEQHREILWPLLPDLPAPARENLATAEDHRSRYRLFEAATSLLCAASQRSPLLLILDDLHWADKPSLLLLRHVLRHPRLTNLLVVGTFRHVESGTGHPLAELLADLRRERHYDRLTLPGLDEDATRALVCDRVGSSVDPGFVRRVREQTHGNAFFIEETIRSLIDAGLSRDEMVTESALDRLGVPEGISEIVMRRVGCLPKQAAEVLTAAAVVGRHFRLEVVAQMVGKPSGQIMGVLEEGMDAGLVIERLDHVDEFSFSHAVVREALYMQLCVSRRARLHHRVATVLEAMADSESVNPAELAHHFLFTLHLTGAAPARRYAIAAGDRATQLLAHEEAAEHYLQAVTLFEEDDAERCEVLLALGRAQRRAGDDAAQLTFQAVADSAARRDDAQQLARAALGHSGRYHESGYTGARSRELLEQALAMIGGGDSPRRALLLSRLAGTIAFTAERHDDASALSAEAVAMARRVVDEEVLLTALMGRHATLLHVGDLDERLVLSTEFMELRIRRGELRAERRHWRLYNLLESGDADAARAEHPRLEALTKQMCQPQWHSIAVGWRGLWAELAGDIAKAERDATECLQLGRCADMKDALSVWAAKLLMLRRRQGRLAELKPTVQRLVRGEGLRKIGWRSALALILAETGDKDTARAIYREEVGAYSQALPQSWLTNIAMLSELCVKLDDAAGARSLYAALAPYAHRTIVVAYASCWGPVDRYLALLAGTYGDDELRGQHARAALARTRALNAPLLTAEVQKHHPDLLVPPPAP